MSYADSSVEQLIIINSAYNTLNFYEDGFLVRKFSCATGKAYTSTPQGKTTVANKIKNRPYYKYGIPGGSPNNPLGRRWIGLFDGDTYAIHGTNEASSIGTNASHGCIRMHNSEVEWLYDQINIGATVLIKNTVSSDKQIAYKVEENAKLNLLKDVTVVENADSCVIFANTQKKVEMIYNELTALNYPCDKIHGGMEQDDRIKVMSNFRKGYFRY